MPRKKESPAADVAAPVIPAELIDQIVKGPMRADTVNAASKAFKKALIERCLGAELFRYLGYVPGAEKPDETSNHRNGTSAKTVLTEDGLSLRMGLSPVKPEVESHLYPWPNFRGHICTTTALA